jgi:hypothetical protein
LREEKKAADELLHYKALMSDEMMQHTKEQNAAYKDFRAAEEDFM